MKKVRLVFLLTILFFSTSHIIIAQNVNNISNVDSMSDEQIAGYWKKAQEQGLSLSQLEQVAKAKGVSDADFLKFKQRVSGLNNPTKNNPTKNSAPEKPKVVGNQKQFGHTGKEIVIVERSNIYGMDFFSNPNISFAPNLNLATPETYQLGPGDELLIDIWGAAENKYTTKVEVDGAIRIENIGPVYVSGLSIADAKTKIISYLRKIYGGINASNSSYNKVNVGLSLVNVRSVQVNIIGEVKVPGTYSLSALSSVLNALYAAGGPTKNGTFRGVKIFRNGKLLDKFDIYKYLTEGNQEGNVTVRDQDIIIVNPYTNKVRVTGAVKRSGSYEIKEGENLNNLIKYFGGFTSNAYKDIINVERVNGKQREITEVEFKNRGSFKIKNGDKFSVDKIIDRYENRIEIKGAVYRPGDFELTDKISVLDLINKAGGLKANAFLNRGVIYRTINDVDQEIISFSVEEILNKTKNIFLKREDKVQIFSSDKMKEKYKVSIVGAINKPQTIPFIEKMTVEDLITISGGFKEGADASLIDISRRDNDGTFKTISKNIKLSSSSSLEKGANNELYLEPFDIVSVRYLKGFTNQKSVSISGEAKYPGDYTLINNEERISDLLNKAGGLSPFAYAKGATLIRKASNSIEEGQNQALESLNEKQDSVNIKRKKSYMVGIKLEEILKNKDSKYNLVLKEGDRLEIPSVKQTVEVQGEVLSGSLVRFDKSKSLKDYINNAGGFTEGARKSKAYVVYANGEIKSTKKFLFFRSYPKIEPGALILVPHKLEVKNSMSLQEVIGITTSITTLGILINSLSK